MGLLPQSSDRLGGQEIELSKAATERTAEKMLEAIEANRAEFLEVKLYFLRIVLKL